MILADSRGFYRSVDKTRLYLEMVIGSRDETGTV